MCMDVGGHMIRGTIGVHGRGWYMSAPIDNSSHRSIKQVNKSNSGVKW